VDAPEDTEVRAERRASACTGGAVDRAAAVLIRLPGPLMDTVADGGRGRMTPPIALPRVGRERRAAGGPVLCDQRRARARLGMGADPEAWLARVPRDDLPPLGSQSSREMTTCCTVAIHEPRKLQS
jgi:hypothetical protein